MARKAATISISLSLLNVQGGLYNVKDTAPTRETKLSRVCPSCKASLLDQLYHCQAGCVPNPAAPSANPKGWTPKEIPDRVKVSGKTLTLVPADEIEATEVGIVAPETLDLLVYPAEQVEAATWPGAVTYCFLPDKPDKVHTMLLAAAKDTSKAFVGIINLRGNEKLYRLVEHEGTLRVMELLRPEETVQFAALADAVVDPKESAVFDQLVTVLADDFDPEVYASTKLANLRALLDSKQGITPATAPTLKAVKTDSTMDAMTAALAAAQAAKGLKKPA